SPRGFLMRKLLWLWDYSGGLMHKSLILLPVAAVMSVAPLAHAVTLKNTDKKTHTVLTQTLKRKEAIKMKPGDVYDSKDQDVTFYLDDVRSVGKADEQYLIENGKIVPDMEAKKEADMAPYQEMFKEGEQKQGEAKADAKQPEQAGGKQP